MKIYSRALDYTVLGLNELVKGNPVLAAKLFATAVKQPDIQGAIATLEANNKYAFTLQASAAKDAKKRLKANAEFPTEVVEEPAPVEEPVVEEPVVDDVSFDTDPLDEIVEEEPAPVVEEPAVAMAAVLASMVRRSGRTEK